MSTALSMHFAALPHPLADTRTGQQMTESALRMQGPMLAEIEIDPQPSSCLSSVVRGRDLRLLLAPAVTSSTVVLVLP
jgi:hypothetical protein